MSVVTPLVPAVLAQAKWAFTTRRVRRDDVASLVGGLNDVRSGDLVLGRVDRIGSHKRIQLPVGRPAELYIGDLVVLVCGDRYAADQFEGVAELDPNGSDMLAGGGVIGRMRSRHARMAMPTRITPLGLLADRTGSIINVVNYGFETTRCPKTMTGIYVVGTAMNSGKTTAAASLAHGLSRAGHRVAAIKATGTGAFGDYNTYVDSGAHCVIDFTDAGMVSTYRQPLARIESAVETMLAHAVAEGCEVVVVELADGVFQQETADLLDSPAFRAGIDGLVFAAPDALAAAGGCAVLRGMGLEPAVLTGMVSCSPLSTAEAEAATGVRVMTRAALCDPAQANGLMAKMVCRSPRETGETAAIAAGTAA